MTQVPKAQLDHNLNADESCSIYDESSSQDTFRNADETEPCTLESHIVCSFVSQQQARKGCSLFVQGAFLHHFSSWWAFAAMGPALIVKRVQGCDDT